MMFIKNVDIYINDNEVFSEQTSSGPQWDDWKDK